VGVERRRRFLITVQPARSGIERASGDYSNGDGDSDFTYKREGR
jgi:hypothetical protein